MTEARAAVPSPATCALIRTASETGRQLMAGIEDFVARAKAALDAFTNDCSHLDDDAYQTAAVTCGLFAVLDLTADLIETIGHINERS